MRITGDAKIVFSQRLLNVQIVLQILANRLIISSGEFSEKKLLLNNSYFTKNIKNLLMCGRNKLFEI